MKVNILGTDYEIIKHTEDGGKFKELNADGYTELYAKELHINLIDDGSPTTVDNLYLYVDKVTRHEIIHAFMYESGLDIESKWGRDEQLIDWLAIQMPKIVKVMKEAKVL